jgi:uncharacterized protein YecT (DUF1311 family)
MLSRRTMLVAIAFVLLSTIAHAKEDTHINRDCDNGAPMLEINQCAGLKSAEADTEMNGLYKEKMAAAKSPESKKRLREGQRAWLTFRDKACLYEAGVEKESGSSWPFHYFGCLEFYTRRRIQDLQLYLRCTTDDCP